MTFLLVGEKRLFSQRDEAVGGKAEQARQDGNSKRGRSRVRTWLDIDRVTGLRRWNDVHLARRWQGPDGIPVRDGVIGAWEQREGQINTGMLLARVK